MITCDSYFAIGDTHIRSGKPCQDYAIAKVIDDRAIAIVCDGCSSGGNTDMGARLLAHSNLISYARQNMIDEILNQCMEALCLGWEDMLSTLVFACIDPNIPNMGILAFLGDGCAVINYTDRTDFLRVNFESNAPYYYVYKMMDDCYYRDYLSMQDEKRITLTCIINEHSINSGNISYRYYTPEEASKGIYVMLEKEPVSITVFTDGVASFANTDWQDACRELTAFKNMSGEYLKRRMTRAIQDYVKRGIRLLDDIAGASLYVGR